MGEYHLKRFLVNQDSRNIHERTHDDLGCLIKANLKRPSDLLPINSDRVSTTRISSICSNMDEAVIKADALLTTKPMEATTSRGSLELSSIELPCSASSFAAYAAARQVILKNDTKIKALKQDISALAKIAEEKLVPIKREQSTAKMLGIGLHCLCDLLSDVSSQHPELCANALRSLCHIVESQRPEEMSAESKPVVDRLFSLLQQISQSGSAGPQLCSIAAKCMLSLAVAYGLPEYILASVACLLSLDAEQANGSHSETPTKQPSSQTAALLVDIPSNFQQLYELSCARLSNEMNRSWLTTVIDYMQPTLSFPLASPFGTATSSKHQSKTSSGSSTSSSSVSSPLSSSAIASDGVYLYILTNGGLFKVGSGCMETQRGHVYAFTRAYRANGPVSLSCRSNKLYLRRKGSVKLWTLNKDTLECAGEQIIPSSAVDGLLCADGHAGFCQLELSKRDGLSLVISSLDDSMRTIKASALIETPEVLPNPVSVILKRTKTVVFGEHQTLPVAEATASLRTSLEDRILDLKIGHKFAALLTTSGTVMYLGAGHMFDMPDVFDRWEELPVAAKIQSIAIGHHGSHLLLLSENGQAYYCGMPSRGEDGEAIRLRKSPAATRCKRITLAEGRRIVSCACNSGTTAYVTDSGQLNMFGKDALNVNPNTGEVCGFETIQLSIVALGKAHCVVVTKRGAVYTFGMNNLGQCGRPELFTQNPDSDSESSSRTATDSSDDHSIDPCALSELCQFACHIWSIKEVSPRQQQSCPLCGRDQRGPVSSSRVTSDQSEAESKSFVTNRMAQNKGFVQCSKCGICKKCAVKLNRRSTEAANFPDIADVEAKLGLVLPPAQISLRALTEQRVVQVACGSYHTLLVTHTGKLFAFGNNRYGQLGLGHTRSTVGPELVLLHANAVQISCGANHSLCRCSDGRVFSFGRFDNGQLLRYGKDAYWNASPAPIEGFEGKILTNVSASGDLSIVTFEFPLLSATTLSNACVSANSNYLILFPRQHHHTLALSSGISYLVLNRHSGKYKVFNCENAAFCSNSFAFDPLFDCIWAFDPEKSIVSCFSLKNGPAACSATTAASSTAYLQNPEFWAPTQKPENGIPACQLASCVLANFTLLSFNRLRENFTNNAKLKSPPSADGLATSSFHNFVNRFQGFGGGWGYSLQSIEAIQFCCDRDILLLGVGLYGGRGEYSAKLKLFRLIDQGADEANIEMLDETAEIPFECAPLEKYHVSLSHAVLCSAKEWYVVCALINGPSSDCGANGLPSVLGDDGTTFWFRNSELSNNGTDVNAGQIPTLIYKPISNVNSITMHTATDNAPTELQYPARLAYPEPAGCTALPSLTFFFGITPPCFRALLNILTLSVRQMRKLLLSYHIADTGTNVVSVVPIWHLEKQQANAIIVVQLLSKYLKLIYPKDSKPPMECQEFVVAVEESFQVFCSVLRLGDEDESFSRKCALLLQTSVQAVVDNFYALFPEPLLLQYFMLEYLTPAGSTKNCWTLYALLSLLNSLDDCLHFVLYCRHSASIRSRFPHLATHLVKHRRHPQVAHEATHHVIDFSAILKTLIGFIFDESAKGVNGNSKASPVAGANAAITAIVSQAQPDVRTAAAILLNKVLCELVQHCSSPELQTPTILQTPCRFSRQSLTMSWDMGNGSPDAIAFQANDANVLVHGVGVYLGNGSYTYNLELLAIKGENLSSELQWVVIEKGTGQILANEHLADVGFLRLSKPVCLGEGVLYAFRVHLQGNRTWSGEGGVPCVQGANGIRFTFHTCSLSLNGTNVIRGQIPTILYSTQTLPKELQRHSSIQPELAVKWVQEILKLVNSKLVPFFSTQLWCANQATIANVASSGRQNSALLHAISSFATTFLGLIMMFLNQQPSLTLEFMHNLEELLPIITSINAQRNRNASSSGTVISSDATTTKSVGNQQSYAQAVVESSHPYKSAQLECSNIRFPDHVKYVTLEFDPKCCSSQSEDSLQLYVDFNQRRCLTPIGRFWGSAAWPHRVLLLPANSLWFIFESASNYTRAEEQSLFGFKCQVVGYSDIPQDPLLLLEREYSYLYAYCCSILLSGTTSSAQPQFQVNVNNGFAHLDDESNEMLKAHGSLLKRGLALDHLPTARELQLAKLTFKSGGCEQGFLKDFISATNSSPAGKLAHWLTPEPFIDVDLCELLLECKQQLESGTPVLITVITKDQYGRIAFSKHCKVEVCVSLAPAAVTVADGVTAQSTSTPALMPSPGALANLQAESPFQPTYLNKARYVCITMMKAFRQYSYEELRFAYTAAKQSKEVFQTVSSNDGAYVARWIPRLSGAFKIECTVDAFLVNKSHVVEVKDGSLVFVQPSFKQPLKSRQSADAASSMRSNLVICKDVLTKGVRIRNAPSLLAKQIGIVPREATVVFLDQVENTDGTWLRLTEDSARVYCFGSRMQQQQQQQSPKYWCLEYNKAIDRLLLVPPTDETRDDLEGHENNAALDDNETVGAINPMQSIVMSCDDRYVVVNCGSKTYNSNKYEIRRHPSSNAAIVGFLSLNDEIQTIGWLENAEGVWVQLQSDSFLRHCVEFSSNSPERAEPEFMQAFVRTQDLHGRVFLQPTLGSHRPISTSLHQHRRRMSERAEDLPGISLQYNVRQVATQTHGSSIQKPIKPKRTLRPNGSLLTQSMPLHSKPTVRVPPRDNAASQFSAVEATSPAVGEAIRYVFAAFVWHEGVVHDIMAAASYLKFHPELSSTKLVEEQIFVQQKSQKHLLFHHSRPTVLAAGQGRIDENDVSEGTTRESLATTDDTSCVALPATLQLTYSIWKEIYAAVLAVVDKHLILPSPPMALRTPCIEKMPNPPRKPNECVCELCEAYFPIPVTFHMRTAHKGCGRSSAGQGYNSLGRYTSGWTGNCGDGGQGNANWYLLCPGCRHSILQTTDSFKEKQRKDKGRIFRISTGGVEPARILKQNAMFLLELNNADNASAQAKKHSTTPQGKPEMEIRTWNINLFPAFGSPANNNANSSETAATGSGNRSNDSNSNVVSGAEWNAQAINNPLSTPCASDPGPKRKKLSDGDYDFYYGEMPSSEPLSYAMGTSGTSRQDKSTTLTGGLMDSQNLIASPSTALRNTVWNNSRQTSTTTATTTANGSSNCNLSATLKRPVVAFVIQHHDLSHVREAMRFAIMRASTYAHAFQVLTWLLHLVTNQQMVEDILICTIRGLSTENYKSNVNEADSRENRRKANSKRWSLCLLSGPACSQMLSQFHAFLNNLVTIMKSTNVPFELQQKCLQCWLLGFIPYDQNLILKSRILQVINKIMSDNAHSNNVKSFCSASAVDIDQLDDVTSVVELQTSSRKHMIGCLTDQTTETFWESGEEDRSSSKFISLTCPSADANLDVIAIHMDNVKDPRIGMVVFHITVNNNRQRFASYSIDQRFVGWIKCCVSYPAVSIELRSVEPTIRIRQLAAFGRLKQRPAKPLQSSPSHLLQFNVVQADAFKLFEAIASNAFSDANAIVPQAPVPHSDESAVRHQIVDILFSKEQLSSLQHYVGGQLASALEKEVVQLRDRFKRNYSFCYGLIALLQRLCSSSYGIQSLSHKSATLHSLAELMLFASSNVQVQVVDILKCIIARFDPNYVNVQSFFENLLITIAKAVTLQIRVQASRTVNTGTLEACVENPSETWHIQKATIPQIAQLIANFMIDVASGRFGEEWSKFVKENIADKILAVAALPLELRTAAACVTLQRFWLAVASLCVIQSEDWLSISHLWPHLTVEKGAARNFCENHDDGVTMAQIWCPSCFMHLCMDCNAILHLSRRNRHHNFEYLSVFDNKINVNLHEGCGRLKLSWLLLMIDHSTMNGMVEIRSDAGKATASAASSHPEDSLLHQPKDVCRFCGAKTASEFFDVCSHVECQAYKAAVCKRMLNCGHFCNGILNEQSCLPCLRCQNEPRLRQDADDMCTICFTETLVSAPSIQLACDHVFHAHCVRAALQRRWPGPRITFSFMLCPICKAEIEHSSLTELLEPQRQLREDVVKKALIRLEYDGMTNCKEITSSDSPYYRNPSKFALDKYAYYVCFKCGRAYFGGEVQCEAFESNEFDPRELLCGACSDVAQAQVCPKHGTDYLEYKCRFCCAVAVFFCFGTTHFCASCHDDFQRLNGLPRYLLPKCPAGPRATQLEGKVCPLKVIHPPTGEEFALGCGICRNIMTF